MIEFQIDQQIEDMFASRKRVTDIAKPVINQQGMSIQSNQQKLELAKRLAAKINFSKNLGPDAMDITASTAKAIFTGDSMAPQVAVSISPYWKPTLWSNV